jgi:hypothetical protein
MGLLISQRLAASGVVSAYATATSVSRYVRNSYTRSFRNGATLGSLTKSISRHSLQVRCPLVNLIANGFIADRETSALSNLEDLTNHPSFE